MAGSNAARFYGRVKERQLFQQMLERPKGGLLLLGDHGIGKTELMNQLVKDAQQRQKYRIAASSRLEASEAQEANEPIRDVIVSVIDSMTRLESDTMKIKDLLGRLRDTLWDKKSDLLMAFFGDVLDRFVGSQTREPAEELYEEHKQTESSLQRARSRLQSEPQSFVYTVRRVLEAITESNSDLKVVLFLDQLERVSEKAWWLLLDLFRSSPQQVYIVVAFLYDRPDIH